VILIAPVADATCMRHASVSCCNRWHGTAYDGYEIRLSRASLATGQYVLLMSRAASMCAAWVRLALPMDLHLRWRRVCRGRSRGRTTRYDRLGGGDGPIDRGIARPPHHPRDRPGRRAASQKSTPIWRSSIPCTIFGFTTSRRCHGFFCTAPEYPIPAPVNSAMTLSRPISRFTAPPKAR
jgi:hypothetical protein